jgi:1-phosphofructokinase family hexose kinase
LIVTVTPNPSIDRTLRIPPLERGTMIRASSATAEAGGKGINVSRALATEGVETLAIVPLSESSAAVVTGMLGSGTPLEPVTIAGEIRVNISLVEADGTVTKVNEPGPPLRDVDVTALLDRTAELGERAAWVVGCGSLPPGAPADLYARIGSRLPGRVPLAVDADGPALKACLDGSIALLKPNRRELEGLVDRDLPTLGDVVDAASAMVDGGIRTVLVSLGSDGAVVVDATGAVHGEAPIEDAINAVGAGDALLAGFLAGGGTPAALSTAIAWSVAACRSPGTRMRPIRAEDCDAVVLHESIDRGRVLEP